MGHGDMIANGLLYCRGLAIGNGMGIFWQTKGALPVAIEQETPPQNTDVMR